MFGPTVEEIEDKIRSELSGELLPEEKLAPLVAEAMQSLAQHLSGRARELDSRTTVKQEMKR